MAKWIAPNERLRAWRTAKEMSLAAAGQLFGVSAVNVRAWELGQKRPAAHRREMITALTGIPPEDWCTAAELEEVERARATVGPPVRTRSRKPGATREPRRAGVARATAREQKARTAS